MTTSCAYCEAKPEYIGYFGCKCAEDCGVGHCPASANDEVRGASHP